MQRVVTLATLVSNFADSPSNKFSPVVSLKTSATHNPDADSEVCALVKFLTTTGITVRDLWLGSQRLSWAGSSARDSSMMGIFVPLHDRQNCR